MIVALKVDLSNVKSRREEQFKMTILSSSVQPEPLPRARPCAECSVKQYSLMSPPPSKADSCEQAITVSDPCAFKLMTP